MWESYSKKNNYTGPNKQRDRNFFDNFALNFVFFAQKPLPRKNSFQKKKVDT